MATKFCLMAALCVIPALTLAQDVSDNSVGEEVTVKEWVERLESKKYSVRNEATRQLQQRGLSVIDQLEEIARESPTEAADRAFEILKRHHAGEDSTLKAAAAEALQRISKTEGHARANAAAEILNPPTEPQRRNAPLRIPMIVPGNLRIQIQGKALGGNAQGLNVRTRVQVRIVNGKKDITVEENGKKLRVLENDKGIRVEKTDAAGKTQTKQYKDVEELKTKDPEAHKKFHNNGRGLNIQINGNPWGGGQRPGINPDIRKRIDELRKQQELRREEMRKQQQQRLRDIRKRQEETQKPELPPQVPLPNQDSEEIKEIEIKSIKVIEV